MEFENAGRSLTFNRFGGPFLSIRGRRGEGGGELIRSVRREGGGWNIGNPMVYTRRVGGS